MKGVATLLLLFVVASARANSPDNTRDEFWPEVDAYIDLNSVARIRLLGSFRNNQPAESWHGDFGAFVDVALKPVFRRALRQREDVFDKRFLSFQSGFRYISRLGAGPPYVEHRWIAELTARYPLPGNFILSDRNRGEFRFISEMPLATRYRNKLQLERDFRMGRFVYTPYLNTELFYDTRYDAWVRNRYSAGVQVPVAGYVVFQPYYLRQNQSRSSPAHMNAFGLELDFYF
jgi:Protein of unknown function (DUF2490)